jgi:pseudaminic acid synthase
MVRPFAIRDRNIASDQPTYVIAEISANHNHNLKQAIDLVHAAKQAGADAVKLQTYRADTMTLDINKAPFIVQGTIWDGRSLYDLYEEAAIPLEWHRPLLDEAQRIGIHLFSSVFDPTAVDFLTNLNVPAFKVSSFELVDIPLIRAVARRGKPIILSTGMAEEKEIWEAVTAIRSVADVPLALLLCTSSYPASPDEAHLRTIPHLQLTFGCQIGLSDHTLGTATAVAAVCLGAAIIEKHITLNRSTGGPDAPFSLEPDEFRRMVDDVRDAQRSLGEVRIGPTQAELATRRYRRSLFVTEDLTAGTKLSSQSVRSLRPADGLHPRHLEEVLGRRVAKPTPRGTPLSWDLLTPDEDR